MDMKYLLFFVWKLPRAYYPFYYLIKSWKIGFEDSINIKDSILFLTFVRRV